MNQFGVSIADPAAIARRIGYPLSGYFFTGLPLVAGAGPYAPAPDARGAPELPADAEADLESILPRYPKGEPCALEGVQRRLARAGKVSTRAEYIYAIQALAIPPEILPASPIRDAVAALPYALWPWGEEGRRLDEVHEQHTRELEAARVAAEEAKRIAAMPNTDPLDAHGTFGVFVPVGAATSAIPPMIAIVPELGVESGLASAIPVEGGSVVVFQTPPGIVMTEGPIPGTVCRVLTKLVLPHPPKKARPCRLRDAMGLRDVDDSPIESFRDLRSTEGAHAVELFRQAFEPFARRLGPHVVKARAMSRDLPNPALPVANADDVADAGRLAVQMAIRGCGLRRELARHVVREAGCQASDARLDSWLDQAIAGTEAWFSPDELYTPPKASLVERFTSLFRADDPWLPVLDELIAKNDTLSSEAIEASIIGAGLHPKAFAPPEFERLASLMGQRGWVKKRVTIDGERTMRWVKA